MRRRIFKHPRHINTWSMNATDWKASKSRRAKKNTWNASIWCVYKFVMVSHDKNRIHANTFGLISMKKPTFSHSIQMNGSDAVQPVTVFRHCAIVKDFIAMPMTLMINANDDADDSFQRKNRHKHKTISRKLCKKMHMTCENVCRSCEWKMWGRVKKICFIKWWRR